MKEFIRNCIPASLQVIRRSILNGINERRLASETPEKIFTDIYKNNAWGGSKGEFCSGDGSRDEKTVMTYVNVVAEKTKAYNMQGSIFVDLGCGDFRVGKKLTPFCYKYIGVDVVSKLIEYNNVVYGNEKTLFVALNIIKDELPDGEVCLVRQVLQHLSNLEIAVILKKLNKYRLVFITEHYPNDNTMIIPNVDMIHGSGIRVTKNSGDYLTAPPFSMPAHEMNLILEVPAPQLGNEGASGIIRTYLYKPQE